MTNMKQKIWRIVLFVCISLLSIIGTVLWINGELDVFSKCCFIIFYINTVLFFLLIPIYKSCLWYRRYRVFQDFFTYVKNCHRERYKLYFQVDTGGNDLELSKEIINDAYLLIILGSTLIIYGILPDHCKIHVLELMKQSEKMITQLQPI